MAKKKMTNKKMMSGDSMKNKKMKAGEGMFVLNKKMGAPANLPQEVKIQMISRNGKDTQAPINDTTAGIKQQVAADSVGFKTGNDKY
jgi:hypothetical protein